MYKPAISTILKKAAEFKSVDETVAYLQRYDTKPIRDICKIIYDPNIKFHKDLPEGKTPYNPSKFDEPGRLYSETKRLYLFIEGATNAQGVVPELTPMKRQQLWIQLLESISPDDAILLDAAKDKKSPWKRISKHVVKKAFPGLLDDSTEEDND